MIDEATVLAALDEIKDPCSVAAGVPAGLHEFGLVREVTISGGDGTVHVDVTLALTEPACLMGALFLRDARQRVQQLAEVDTVTVRLDPTFRWSEQSQSAGYRARLARFRERAVQP